MTKERKPQDPENVTMTQEAWEAHIRQIAPKIILRIVEAVDKGLLLSVNQSNNGKMVAKEDGTLEYVPGNRTTIEFVINDGEKI